MQGVTSACVYIKGIKTFTYHEDFPDTVNGEKITQKIKVLSLESFGVLYSLLEIQKQGRGNRTHIKMYHLHNHPQHRSTNSSKHRLILLHLLIQMFLNSQVVTHKLMNGFRGMRHTPACI